MNIVTITYNLNGGSGTKPANESCKKGQPCTLNDGATTTFYRAGYVFKGWALTSTATSGFTSRIFNADDIVYAVWEPCGMGTYKPSTANANATCSACPALTEGFKYVPDTGLISVRECYQGLTDPRLYNENCINQGSSDSYSVMCYASTNNDWYRCAIASSATGAFVAGPGVYLSSALSFGFFDIPYANLSEILSQACIECSAGTYSPGGNVTSCSACPELTDGFEYVPTTGNTSLTACRQGIANAEDVNEYCATSSETTELFDILCYATSDGTWGDCAIGNAWTAKPGSYVGIWKQEMPAEDVIENMCIQCTDGTYSSGGTVSSCSACPALSTADERDGWKISSGGYGATSSQDCYAYLESYPTNCASGSFKRMLFGGGTGYYGSEWFELEPLTAEPGYIVQFEDGQTTAPACVACTVGTFSPGGDVHSCSACPSGYDDNPETGLTSPDMCQISCPGGYYLAAANDATCSEVSPGYWAAAKVVNYGGTSTRTECASGLTTIGYGAGADEAADCGRVLHFGDDTLYLRSVKKTDHALHVGINGTVFYGNMGTDLSKSGLRIKLGDTTYSVYDDSM